MRPDGFGERLASDLGVRFCETLQFRPKTQVFRVRRGGEDLVLKVWAGDPEASAYPGTAYRAVGCAAVGGRRLVVPQFVADGAHPEFGRYVLMTFLPGNTYHGRWHYTRPRLAGGLSLSAKDIELAIELLADLRAAPLTDVGLRRLSHEKISTATERHLAEFTRVGFFNDEEADAVLEAAAALGRTMSDALPSASNGDFRHLNFVEMEPGKTGVIDWDGAQCSAFESELCAAYLWLLLWNRPDLQQLLLETAGRELGLDRERLGWVLLVRAIQQIHVCRDVAEAQAVQIRQARQLIARRGV